MLKTINFFKFFLIFLTITCGLHPLNARKNVSYYFIGPSITKHFVASYRNFREFHPGFGAEVQLSINHLLLGWHGYYMIKDSNDEQAFWTGLTVGWHFVKKDKLWIAPFIILGGIKKREYRSGKFSFFPLPVFSAGYKFIGFNLAYIPKIRRVTEPILILQIKLRL